MCGRRESDDRCVVGGTVIGDYMKMFLTLKLVCLTTGNMLMTSSSVNGCLVNKSYSLRNSCVPVGVKKSVGWIGEGVGGWGGGGCGWRGRVWVEGEGVGGGGGCGWRGRVWVEGEGVGGGGGCGWRGRVWADGEGEGVGGWGGGGCGWMGGGGCGWMGRVWMDGEGRVWVMGRVWRCVEIAKSSYKPLPIQTPCDLLPSSITPPVFLQNCRSSDVLFMCRVLQTADKFGLVGVASHVMIT